MICLIIPPSPFLLDERVFMSLGVLKVAAALETAGEKVQVFDLSGVKDYETAARNAPKADVYGITATSPQMPAAVRIARQLTRPVILGGPHATLVHAALQRSDRAKRAFAKLAALFDVVVAGDGERAILAALHAEPHSFINADDRHSPYWMGDKDLDASPFPARHLIDVASYKYEIDGVPALSLIAQLGCPFGCGFCAGRHSPMLRHIRSRSKQSIVAEMVLLAELYGTRGFMFYDDELNVNPRLVELMDEIYRVQFARGEEWRLRGFIKAELFTDDQAYAMRRAGFRWILVGFESGSPRILENIRKKATRSDNTRCIEIAHRAGLKVKALMSLGHPGESWETSRETRDWLEWVKPDDFDMTVITPYPGSPYYDDAEQHGSDWVYTCPNGDRLYQDEVDYTAEADYYKGVPGEYVSHVWTDHISRTLLAHRRDELDGRLRATLNIALPAAVARSYEHSMGQTAA